MSKQRIATAFQDGKAFIPFITCGDPDMATTKALVRTLEENGASLIELGIPFSDPTAEGPVIQEANLRALSAGCDTDAVFALVDELRCGSDGEKPVEVPLVFMTYANVVFHYGTEKFCERAAQVGIDGLILPDVPFEEKQEFASACNDADLALISLIAPTSEDRIRMIAKEAQGFIYLVSSLGVTGTRSEITTDLKTLVDRIREVTSLPVAIGFGISNAEQAQAMASLCDGAIMGSALVKLVAAYGAQAPTHVSLFAREVARAVHGA